MEPVAVLCSGGLDSSVLVAEEAASHEVHPLYVRAGLIWESAEQTALHAFLAAIAHPRVQPLAVLEQPVQTIYGGHWSLTGDGIPQGDILDQAMYLPGRNILMLAAAATWCSLREIHRILVASVDYNRTFFDARPEFFAGLAVLMAKGLGHDLRIEAPFSHLSKSEVICRGRSLPLELTLTCADPRAGSHCGSCRKCHERRSAFARSGVPDRTRYAAVS